MRWMKGYLLCCVNSGHWERFMNLCRHHRIELWNVEIHKNHVMFQMFSKDYKALSLFVGKTHVIPHIMEKKGLPFLCGKAFQNWTFTFGLVLFFLVLRVLSLFVWQINYYGQREYTKETISKEVTQMGVYPGMLRRNLNCDSIERTLRESYDNMSWVSAEETGCVLNIKIKEGNAQDKKGEEEEKPKHMTAPCDGVVKSIVTREGTPKVAQGAQVKKGDVLISGIVEVIGDDEAVVKRNSVSAEGEISLLTRVDYEDSINIHHLAKNKTGKDITVYTICFNGNRFSIKNPLKWFDNSSNYDIINNVCVDEKCIPLNSRLKITEKKYICYEQAEMEYSEKEAEGILKSRFESRKMEYEESGCKVTNQTFQVKKEKNMYRASGKITMLVSQMGKRDITEAELLSEDELLPDEDRKEDGNGTGTENS